MFQPQTTATFSDNSQQNEKLVTSCEAFPPSRNLSYQNSVCNPCTCAIPVWETILTIPFSTHCWRIILVTSEASKNQNYLTTGSEKSDRHKLAYQRIKFPQISNLFRNKFCIFRIVNSQSYKQFLHIYFGDSQLYKLLALHTNTCTSTKRKWYLE